MGGAYRPDEFEVRIDSADGIFTVSVTGELDIGTVDICLGWIDGHPLNGETKVVVDLQAITFVDSAGFRALMTARDRLSQQGPRVEFVNPSPAVTRVTEIFGVDLTGDLDLREKQPSC